MKRTGKAAVAVAALVTLLSGCVLDIWAYGAQMRGAPVLPDPLGQPDHSYTGPAGQGRDFDTCYWVLNEHPDINETQAHFACHVNLRWKKFSLGVARF